MAGGDGAFGNGGDDAFYAANGLADTLNGGKGADTATVDVHDRTKNVETIQLVTSP